MGLDNVLDTPAGKFEKVLETEETNALKPDEKDSKFYAPGIGLNEEEILKLYACPRIQNLCQIWSTNNQPTQMEETDFSD